MTDHADTIRRALTGIYIPSKFRNDAIDALDALLAERQQAQDKLWEQSEAAENLVKEVERLEAERQQAQQERDGYLKRVDEVNAERMRQEVRAEQAIDALDKVTRAGTVTEACRIASVALEKLGESR